MSPSLMRLASALSQEARQEHDLLYPELEGKTRAKRAEFFQGVWQRIEERPFDSTGPLTFEEHGARYWQQPKPKSV